MIELNGCFVHQPIIHAARQL